MCGGVLENEYDSNEKKQLQAGFRALDVINDNKKPLSQIKPTDLKETVKKEPNNEKNSNNYMKSENNTNNSENNVKIEKNSNDESDRVRKLVEETTKRTNEVNY